MSFYSQGLNTYKVPYTLYKDNRLRFLDAFNKEVNPSPQEAIVLQGGAQLQRYDTDCDIVFRQESYFHYIFGVKEADCFGVLLPASKTSVLFVPRYPESYAVWMGEIHPPSHFQSIYLVDEVHFVDEIASYLKSNGIEKIHIMNGVNSDSGSKSPPTNFEGMTDFQVEREKLYPVITECRVIKSPEEIDVLRYVNKVSSDAHKYVMRNCKAGMMEYQLESMFLHHVYTFGGCRHVSYTCICPNGHQTAVLHYGHAGAPNDRVIEEGAMLLLDMGAEYHCYGSDITCSYPVNGKFTEDQKNIYEAVLAAVMAVRTSMKPGVAWVDMHLLAESVILEHLLRLGLVHNGTVQELQDACIGALFFPHGLGHFLGLDVHDVGGYPSCGPQRHERPGLRSLRTMRTLQAGMFLTVEPGLYFIPSSLEKAFKCEKQSKYLNESLLRKFFSFGGVRIEEDVIVTQDGVEVLTQVPRTVQEIEDWMAGRN